MSAIFKQRKIPKHLIIQEENVSRRRPRNSLLRFMGWSLVLVAITWGFIVLQSGFAL